MHTLGGYILDLMDTHHDHPPTTPAPADHAHRPQVDPGHDGHEEHADHTGHGGHASHAGHGDHVAQFRRLFWIMLVLAVPTVAFNDMFADMLGYGLPDAEWVRWVSPLLGTVLYVWGGRPFLVGAAAELRARRPGMMLLISLALTVAFVASWGSRCTCSTTT